MTHVFTSARGAAPSCALLLLACSFAYVQGSEMNVTYGYSPLENTTDEAWSVAVDKLGDSAGFSKIGAAVELLFTAIGLPLGTEDQTEMDLIRAQVEWKQGLALWIVPGPVREQLPELVQSWIANFLLAAGLYLGLGAVWCFFIYGVFKNTRFGVPENTIPSKEAVLEQVMVSLSAIPLYSTMPVATEYMVLKGWTLAYGRVSTFGIPSYFVFFFLYMMNVEYGVYWMHRKLHELKFGYKYLHATHHVYNKEHTLSPMAGLAFNPIDGMLQAVPYLWGMFLVPMHFFTTEALLFATAVWTTSIHDCIDAGMEPIMGAGYHTIHHTTYKHNYGHYTILMDKLFGTLRVPPQSKPTKKNN
mmetsp:Transcript_21101/g.25378  ORF Transcript_21101/g.25378 Transcript_21101/m.25378 type:complete len:358 (+) Transcript_21101:262-1335(+)|eukprot:CAMPEP_0197863902 /NCGR_PEP_ID=MMETSP1438-20131217/41708_1 /TAXON_ID=1461541 /ORGANISM="Pterosperma sp., Strain CCMP1384" /LENGTH=357 /DNA_ID=CAMNT_0043481959 /DNA_START=261 /DNA_END=1334 /DNA_ORIENTATION=+